MCYAFETGKVGMCMFACAFKRKREREQSCVHECTRMFLRIREREREIQIDRERVGAGGRTETERDRERQRETERQTHSVCCMDGA